MRWALIPLALTPLVFSQTAEPVRPPGVAGAFYPRDATELAKTVDAFLSRAGEPAPASGIVAVVAPHAGYAYSGAVAAHSYAILEGRKITRVVVIAPSHYDAFPFSAVYDGGGYATPLGTVRIDREFAAKLVSREPRLKLSGRGHTVGEGRGEHALEVQLPFLQRVLGDFKLVPVVMGEQTYDASRALGVALAGNIRGAETLIVASSDLSHFHKYEEAERMDRRTLRAITEWDYLSMSANFSRQVWEACGGGPIIAAMIAAERLGATQAKLLQYANSGDVAGDRARVVGYGAVAFVKGAPARSAAPFHLSPAAQEELLAIARTAVETAVRDRRVYAPPLPSSGSLRLERGAFVTLRRMGGLRGCIGSFSASTPLYLTVRDAAVMAATEDQRFRPVGAGELRELEYEISVLSPLRRILDVRQLRIGLDGIFIRRDNHDGLLLPQVAAEEGWNLGQFLEQVCLKAGLHTDAWRDERTDIFAFTAIVFTDRKTGRAVNRRSTAPPTWTPARWVPGSGELPDRLRQ